MDGFAWLSCCQTSPVPFLESRKDIKRLSTPVQSRFSSFGTRQTARTPFGTDETAKPRRRDAKETPLGVERLLTPKQEARYADLGA